MKRGAWLGVALAISTLLVAVTAVSLPAASSADPQAQASPDGPPEGLTTFLDDLIDKKRTEHLFAGGLWKVLFERMTARGIREHQGKELSGIAAASTDGVPLAGAPAAARDGGSRLSSPVSTWGAEAHVDGQSGSFRHNFGANEPSVAVHPTNANNLIAAYHDERGIVGTANNRQYRLVRISCSSDGGVTWSTPAFSTPGLPGLPGATPGRGFPFTFDPSCALALTARPT